MENNSDKQLRDKLRGVELPFDPQAWEQMEAMLDKKKKRRGFFWWWTGGVAAALLFAVVGYELGVNSGKARLAIGNEQQPATSEQQSSSNEKPEEPVVVSNNEQQSLNNKKALTENVKTISKTQNAQGKEKNRTQTAKEGQEKESTALIAGGNLSNHHFSAVSFKQKHKQRLTVKTNEAKINNADASFEKNPFQQEADMLASAAAKGSTAERIEMDRRFALLEPFNEQYSFDKKSEEALPKKNKRIFNYSLGTVANITGIILSNPDSLKGFYNKPSYAVGFTHDFLFINRIAITNSLLYAQTGFKVYYPVTPTDSSSVTTSYSSAISELQIPLGIKAYPLNKKWLRFYIAAGVINHIKLKEVFTVEKMQYNTMLQPNILDNNVVSIADNPFLEGLNKSSNVYNATNTDPGTQAEFYGMGGLRRYYASFYASVGVEFIAKKHFVFFTEPMFYMSLKKIGLQDKHKYNLGVSGGFRYQF